MSINDEIQDLYGKLRNLDVMRSKQKQDSKQHRYLSREIKKIMIQVQRLRSVQQLEEPSAEQPDG
jgi:hypothetical protein